MPELQRPAGPLHYEITDLPLAIAREIHALVPGSELQEFPGLRHAIAYSHGPSCARALRAFLTRRGLGGRDGPRPTREGSE